jgi:hypothetical protein
VGNRIPEPSGSPTAPTQTEFRRQPTDHEGSRHISLGPATELAGSGGRELESSLERHAAAWSELAHRSGAELAKLKAAGELTQAECEELLDLLSKDDE